MKVINNNNEIIEVTERAYEVLYKERGFKIYAEPKKEVKEASTKTATTEKEANKKTVAKKATTKKPASKKQVKADGK